VYVFVSYLKIKNLNWEYKKRVVFE